MHAKPDSSPLKKTRNGKIIFRIVICALILALGAGTMAGLSRMKKRPPESRRVERPLRVEAVRVVPRAVRVYLAGLGRARPLDQVVISAEVSGKVVRIHPELKPGQVISEGDLLFEIDPRDYLAVVREAEASVAQAEASLKQLRMQQRTNQVRLKTARRNMELARREYERIRHLFEQDQVGTRSAVEQAERAYNSARDLVDQLSLTVELYPARTQEVESALTAAQARLARARTSLERCRVKAPFEGRVVSVSVEKDQFVSPGQPLLTLADDSVLEIQVSLDGDELAQWLTFLPDSHQNTGAWFPPLARVPCEIRSTQGGGGNVWQGTLHRVVAFQKKTRTVTVAVRVTAEQARTSSPEGLLLVAGMFCSVRIPGRILQNAVVLPRQAVSFENTVYRVVDGRLKTTPVQVARTETDTVYVTGGLSAGDIVITTRLVAPLENSLVEVSNLPSDRRKSPKPDVNMGS